MSPVASVSRIIELIQREFPLLRGVALTSETPLVSTGLLDSFALVTLLATLDEAFGIDLEVEQIDLQALETPANIAQLCEDAVRARLAGGGGAGGG